MPDSSPVTLNCYFLRVQAPLSKSAHEIPSVPGCAPTIPTQEAFRPPPLNHTIRKKAPVTTSSPWTCLQFIGVDRDRPAGPPEAETVPSPANPKSKGQSRKGRYKGDGRKGRCQQTTIPSNLHSHEFMSHMKKLDRSTCVGIWGESDGAAQSWRGGFFDPDCHTEKNPSQPLM